MDNAASGLIAVALLAIPAVWIVKRSRLFTGFMHAFWHVVLTGLFGGRK